MNRDSLYYLEYLDAYEVMETHIMDRVMHEYWRGNMDTNGHFFECSSAFLILSLSGGSERKLDYDYEYHNRFYRRRDLQRVKPHRLSFKAVRDSMQMRYFFEMAFFLILVVIFQS